MSTGFGPQATQFRITYFQLTIKPLYFPTSTSEMQAIVEQPTKDDVMFGRDAQSLNNKGNKRFRAIVSKYQEPYGSAKCRSEKIAIVDTIVNEVRQNGARFLRKNKRTKQWYEVDRKAAIEKVRH